MPKTNLDVLIQEALDLLVVGDLASFASSVETARAMLRKFPHFVTGEFPEHLRAAFVEQEGREPDDAVDLQEEVLEPGHRESRLSDAIEIAHNWMERDRSPKAPRLSPEAAAEHDAKFLSDLGIADPGASHV